jgi:thioredoxin-dependent peroxiredoxin
VRDNLTSLQRNDIQPIGVNPGNAESHRQFREKYNFPFELLVDEGLKVAEAFGALNEQGNGISRSVVVVGKDGTVVFSEPGAPAMPRVINAVKAATTADD